MAKKFALLFILILSGCACAGAQCAAGSLAIIVNKSNPTESLSVAQLRRLLIGDVRAWPDIMSAEFRGEEAMTMQAADSDATSARLVAGSAGSIAIVEISSIPAIGSTVKIIRVNGKNPGEPGYPL